MHINPYLNFSGSCEEAFTFYAKALGGKIAVMMTFQDSPMAQQMPEAWRKKIMHARLVAGDAVLMGSDAPPDRYKTPQGFSVSLNVTTAAEADRIWSALSEGATIIMPIQKTFWALRFGMLNDRFGIPWMINCEEHA